MDAVTPVTEATETCARLALLLFCPFCKSSNLLFQGSHTLKFGEAVSSGVIGDVAQEFLQNVEVLEANSSVKSILAFHSDAWEQHCMVIMKQALHSPEKSGSWSCLLRRRNEGLT